MKNFNKKHKLSNMNKNEVSKELKKHNPKEFIKTIKKSFENTMDYNDEWKKYIKASEKEYKDGNINTQDKIKVAYTIINILNNKIKNYINSNELDKVVNIQSLIIKIKDYIIEYTNKESDWSEKIVIQYHGFSENYMYEPINKKKMQKTKAFKKWKKNFPYSTLPSRKDLENIGIDFNKPIDLHIEFKALKKFDRQNFLKSFIDLLFNHFQVDDRIISDLSMSDLGNCNSYEEGLITFQIRNKIS